MKNFFNIIAITSSVSALYNPIGRFQRNSVDHHEIDIFQINPENRNLPNDQLMDDYLRASLREIVTHLAEGPGDSHNYRLEKPTEFKVKASRSKKIIELETLRKQLNAKNKAKNRRNRARGLWQKHHRNLKH